MGLGPEVAPDRTCLDWGSHACAQNMPSMSLVVAHAPACNHSYEQSPCPHRCSCGPIIVDVNATIQCIRFLRTHHALSTVFDAPLTPLHSVHAVLGEAQKQLMDESRADHREHILRCIETARGAHARVVHGCGMSACMHGLRWNALRMMPMACCRPSAKSWTGLLLVLQSACRRSAQGAQEADQARQPRARGQHAARREFKSRGPGFTAWLRPP